VMLPLKTISAVVCCIAFVPCLVVIVLNKSTHANCRTLLVVSALSQQVMLISQVLMFTYDIRIDNWMPATEMDEYWFCMVHECCYFITTFVAILIVLERLIATVKAESYESRPVNKKLLIFLLLIGV
ncbi:hypothetical protein PENTCL1PPCAC_14766, partial [Pristionchus entomophagus]